MNASAGSRDEPAAGGSRRVLSPLERTSEVLFGLIMALTFTGSLSVASAGREDVRTMLIGALGCNLAWGIVDAVLYMVGALVERGRGLALWRAVRQAPAGERARALVAEALPGPVAAVLRPSDLDFIRTQLAAGPEPPADVSMTSQDVRGAVGVLLLVFLATFPVALPFVFVHETRLALRISNGIALVMLFLGGYSLGRYVGGRRLRPGLAMMALGVVLVAIIMALGG